ncbi:Calmodulin-binding transcription activator protein with CG-1 and Ankyrin domains isoform 2 [Theobroma cacao]|uniref:Calmodulin-binding transcription activator protein with CG-1 and Ankyrin domains isoform 2 n=1 Tax=Theobroma cacao TaxID=3641 RepID=A0A061E452_THECC|nr:Calmodulin-binding transcription activator protein with CG-1 and Ankyrin domains isoform 2 [Theobroma cacao]
MAQSEYDINNLFREAQARWLKPAEVFFILQNHEKYELTQEPPQKPTGGSLFLFNKRVLRFFRKDGHSWRKKKDGRTVGEAHERLKVGNVETLNCYYAHGAQNPNFQRRSYWMLEPAYEHIVLVHYREINEAKPSSASIVQSPVSSSGFSLSPNSYTSQNPGSNSLASDVHEPYQNSSSPGSVEVSSDIVIKNNGIDNAVEFASSADLQVSEALKRLEEQLSLNEDSFKEMSPLCCLDGDTNDSRFLEYGREITKQELQAGLLYEPNDIVQDHLYSQHPRVENYSNSFGLLPDGGKNGQNSQVYVSDSSDGSKESLYWKNVFDSCKTQSGVDSQGKPLTSSRTGPASQQEESRWLNINGSNIGDSSVLLHQEVENDIIPSYSSAIEGVDTNSDYYAMLFNQDGIGVPLAADSSLTVAQKQKFTIAEVSPEWGYSSEATKVIIVGSFLCDPLESAWACMFGETEVPLEIIQEGVICCKAPPHLPGKVTLCITSGNRESCSEVREFEYIANTNSCAQCNLSHKEANRSPEELLLLVRFVQLLLSDSLQKDSIESGIYLRSKFKADDDSWSHVIEALLVGSGTSSGTVDWLLEELLKDKLQQWLCSRSKGAVDQSGCTMSKKEQGIIHMAAGLGFEWALTPILNHGVGINFRDINGWTALHWAARIGREKMVAALIASGASAGAVTDPTSQDPSGKTAAFIAASSGNKGLAGYLSELALTSHLSSLTLEESELSKGSAAVQAEMAVNSVSKGSLATGEDQLSLKDTLAAVRNAAQAAARIQNAFRAHSFRKRQQKEAVATAASVDEYGISSDEIQGLSTLSKLAFGNARDYNSAALSIQKKFRGWKGRKDFLALRQKVVKIQQAHVRGYQVRKNYKVICWAVGVLDKVVLRWRRKGVGLRGFRSEPESIDESEDEDILKVFRKQKVDVAVDEAVSRVLSMVDSPDARQQYRRMLERYRQAKADLVNTNEPAASTSIGDTYDMESDESFQFP